MVAFVTMFDVKHFHTLCSPAGLRFGCGGVFLCGSVQVRARRPADLSPKVAAGRFFSHGGEECCDGVVDFLDDCRSAGLDYFGEVVAAEEYAVSILTAPNGKRCAIFGTLLVPLTGNAADNLAALYSSDGEAVLRLRGDGSYAFDGEKQGDVPVLGTTPVTGPSILGPMPPLGDADPLSHLHPADRESARRLNEALAEE